MNPLFGQGPHVYISYAPSDSTFALTLVKDLKARGVPAWIDQFGTESTGLARELERQSQALSARLFLLVLSPAALEGRHALVDEATGLKEAGIKIVPILYQDCPVPTEFRDDRIVDFRGPYAPAFERLLTTVGRPARKRPRRAPK
jgi:hypothetical protein